LKVILMVIAPVPLTENIEASLLEDEQRAKTSQGPQQKPGQIN
jgi:hypothetical protein